MKLQVLLSTVADLKKAAQHQKNHAEIRRVIESQNLVWQHFGAVSLFTNCSFFAMNWWTRRMSVFIHKNPPGGSSADYWLKFYGFPQWVKTEETENGYVLSFSLAVAVKVITRELIAGFKAANEAERLHRRLRESGQCSHLGYNGWDWRKRYAADSLRRRNRTALRGYQYEILALAFPELRVFWSSDAQLVENNHNILAGNGGMTFAY